MKKLNETISGINPDGNWNNPFGIRRQYLDGYGLQVYTGGDPVNNFDPWGLWKYALWRIKGVRYFFS